MKDKKTKKTKTKSERNKFQPHESFVSVLRQSKSRLGKVCGDQAKALDLYRAGWQSWVLLDGQSKAFEQLTEGGQLGLVLRRAIDDAAADVKEGATSTRADGGHHRAHLSRRGGL